MRKATMSNFLIWDVVLVFLQAFHHLPHLAFLFKYSSVYLSILTKWNIFPFPFLSLQLDCSCTSPTLSSSAVLLFLSHFFISHSFSFRFSFGLDELFLYFSKLSLFKLSYLFGIFTLGFLLNFIPFAFLSHFPDVFFVYSSFPLFPLLHPLLSCFSFILQSPLPFSSPSSKAFSAAF